jgi:hypothetical protein
MERLNPGGIITCKRCGTKNRVPRFSRKLRPICGNCRLPLVESLTAKIKRTALRRKPIWIGVCILMALGGLAVAYLHLTRPVHPLPDNGATTYYSKRDAIASLTISSPAGTGNYFVKLTAWTSGTTTMTIFVRAGQSVTTKVPLGSYRIKYATGHQWGGETLLFGPETGYAMVDERFDFVQTDGSAKALPIERLLQLNATLRASKISARDF